MYHNSGLFWRSHLEKGLKEDHWQWDWCTFPVSEKCEDHERVARVIVKEPGVWAAEGLVQAAMLLGSEMVGLDQSGLKTLHVCKDGEKVSAGDEVCRWQGPGHVILLLERSFLNLASYVSGIATQTRKIVEKVAKGKISPCPRVTATRKILPGYRDLALHGVCVGGGHTHRIGLSGGVLIKENHIAALGGVQNAIQEIRKSAPHGLKIEVEVRNLDELRTAVEEKADIVLLDNFSPAEVKEAIHWVKKSDHKIEIEVSGGLNEKNIEEYLIEGVNYMSMGSLTHTVKALDLSLLME